MITGVVTGMVDFKARSPKISFEKIMVAQGLQFCLLASIRQSNVRVTEILKKKLWHILNFNFEPIQITKWNFITSSLLNKK